MLAAELQAFSYGYRLFKELAAGEAQAGAHAYACWEESSLGACAGTSGPAPGICSRVPELSRHEDLGRRVGHARCCECSRHVQESRGRAIADVIS